MTSVRGMLAALVALALVTGCGGPDREERWRQREDSIGLQLKDTVYTRRLRDVIRRGKAVSVDSLARLYVSAATTPDSGMYRILWAVDCEMMSMMHRHGGAAFRRATRRMTDSLQRAGVDFWRAEARISSAAPPPAGVSKEQFCPRVSGPALPDSLWLEPPHPRDTAGRGRSGGG